MTLTKFKIISKVFDTSIDKKFKYNSQGKKVQKRKEIREQKMILTAQIFFSKEQVKNDVSVQIFIKAYAECLF